MDLTIQLQRQIDNPTLTFTERARLRCQLAKELVNTGEYEAARVAMGELWQSIGERPRLDGLDSRTAAEVLLRAGSLSGWIGSAQQINGAQEIAKDLISESIRVFETIKESEKVAEAYIDLALCYWREASFDEARVALREARKLLTDENVEQRARVLMNSAIVENSLNRFDDGLRLLMEAAPLFEQSGSHAAKGQFHGQLGLTLKKLGTLGQRRDYIERAIIEYSASVYHYEQAGHKRYLARTMNNLGFLLYTAGRLTEAYEYLDRAHRLFSSLKDSWGIAQLNDTRARVFLAEGRNIEAERIANGSVLTLERGDELSILAEALTTHGVALARLGRYEEAKAALGRALETTAHAGDNESAGMAAITMMEELGTQLSYGELQDMYERADILLANSQNTETLRRLRSCARLAVEAARDRAAESNAPSFVYVDECTGQLLRTAHLIAGTQSTVLITGETGTGKEVLARLIHQWSGRAGEFVQVNCGALTETLFESLLFGHVQGGRKESLRERAGAVRQAAGGTLFLDEIAKLSLSSQGKLIRLIECGEIHAIGAPLPERIDLRVIASASCELEPMVARGEFRADLFYRLNTFHLIVPPLRERADDIPPLAEYFIKELQGVHNKHVTFMPAAVEAMRKLHLKGNARELRELIERTLLTAEDGAVITPEAVDALAVRRLVNMPTLSDPWEGCSLKAEVQEFESNLVKLALEAANGRVTLAARLLGITHQRLCAMLQSRHKSLLPAKKISASRNQSVIRKLKP